MSRRIMLFDAAGEVIERPQGSKSGLAKHQFLPTFYRGMSTGLYWLVSHGLKAFPDQVTPFYITDTGVHVIYFGVAHWELWRLDKALAAFSRYNLIVPQSVVDASEPLVQRPRVELSVNRIPSRHARVEVLPEEELTTVLTSCHFPAYAHNELIAQIAGKTLPLSVVVDALERWQHDYHTITSKRFGVTAVLNPRDQSVAMCFAWWNRANKLFT